MGKRRKTLYLVIGKGPFDGIQGETRAVSPDEAIRNIAFRKGIRDKYYYFRANVEVKAITNSSCNFKQPPNVNFQKWIERRKD